MYRAELPPVADLPHCAPVDAPKLAIDALWLEEGGPDQVHGLWAGNYFRKHRSAVGNLAMLRMARLPRTTGRRRMLQEAALEVWLSRHRSAAELQQELAGCAYFGRGALGLSSAANAWFHKRARDLTIAEIAVLAGLPEAPAMYARDPETARERRHYVLRDMAAHGLISEDERARADAEPLDVR